MPRDFSITPRVMQYMQSHPGTIVTPTDVAEALDVPRDKAVSSLGFLTHTKHQLTSPTKGQYVYQAEQAKAVTGEMVPGDLFEYVGKTKNGDRIARGPDDNIYVLSRL